MKIGALGPKGSYSSQVADRIGGDDYKLIETESNKNTILRLNDFDVGILPISNKYGGVVAGNMETISDEIQDGNTIYHLGTYNHRINHVLAISPNDCKPYRQANQVGEIYSHPQALRQCRIKIKRNNNTPIPANSTTEKIGDLQDGQGIICSKQAADNHNLIIVDENYAPDDNITSFAILSRQNDICLRMNHIVDTKIMAIGEVSDERGALLHMLGVFHELGMNLSFIESVANGEGGYRFPIVADIPDKCSDKKTLKSTLQNKAASQNMGITIL